MIPAQCKNFILTDTLRVKVRSVHQS